MSKPKPDGWHMYHVCDGKMRELSRTKQGALCVACGEWAEIVVSQTRSIVNEGRTYSTGPNVEGATNA